GGRAHIDRRCRGSRRCPQQDRRSFKVEYHTHIVNRGFIPAQIKAGVVAKDGTAKYTGLHALRHFYASLCINPQEHGGLGLMPKAVQERLGHSSITMTYDRYGTCSRAGMTPSCWMRLRARSLRHRCNM